MDRNIVNVTALTNPKRLVDKTIHPMTTVNLSPSDVVNSKAGVIPVGFYRGGVAFWDLDLAVKQPLVAAEQLHILGILNGSTLGRDLVATTSPISMTLGSAYAAGQLIVPAGQVWYVNAIETFVGVDPAPGAIFGGNFRVSIWPDTATLADPNGQAFYATNNLTGTYDAEFHNQALLIAFTNKGVALRLPAGSTVTQTIVATTAGIASAAVALHTLKLFGYVAKSLVA